MKWTVKEHIYCESIDGCVEQELTVEAARQSPVVGLWNVDPEYEEWNNVVSKFNQLLWYQCSEAACKVEHNPVVRVRTYNVMYVSCDIITSHVNSIALQITWH